MNRGAKLGFGAALLALLFLGTASYARDVPVSIKWYGTVVDTAINVLDDVPPEIPLVANLIDAQAKGSFGATRVTVFTEFVYDPMVECYDEYGQKNQAILPLTIGFAKPVLTFANGDQLWGDTTKGWMCLNTDTGFFEGQAEGEYKGGTGRFTGASGTFYVDFRGQNLTGNFGAIQGEVTGKVELQ